MRRKIFLTAALAVFALALLACNQPQPQQPASPTPPPPPPKVSAKAYATPDIVDCSAECATANSNGGVFDLDLGDTAPNHPTVCLTPEGGESVIFKKTGKKIKIKKFINIAKDEVESPFSFTPPFPKDHLKKVGSGPIKATAIPPGSTSSKVCYRYKTVGEEEGGTELDPHIFTHGGGTGLPSGTSGGSLALKKP